MSTNGNGGLTFICDVTGIAKSQINKYNTNRIFNFIEKIYNYRTQKRYENEKEKKI